MLINHPIEEYGPLRGKYIRSGNEIYGIPTVLIRNLCVFLFNTYLLTYECMFSVMYKGSLES